MKAKLQTLKHNRQGGFTLVEIAIVLVIIGLLLGAVFKGQELINQAKIKNAYQMIDGIRAAHYTYIEKENKVAGDTDKDGIINSDATYWSDLSSSNLVTGVDPNANPVTGPKNPYGITLKTAGQNQNFLCTKLPDNVIVKLEARYDDNDGTSGSFLYTTSDPENGNDITGENLPSNATANLNWWCTIL